MTNIATDLAQAVLVSHLDMIVDVLNFVGIPHEDGFFAKDLDAKPHLTEGWEARVFENFKGKYSEALVVVLHQSSLRGSCWRGKILRPGRLNEWRIL